MQVSVVMGVYNAEKRVREAIRSILTQTFSDFEFIIVNDGSTDSTLARIAEFKDPRILIQNIPHGGLTKALNSGCKLARGEYIARMDADDISFSTRLEKQIERLEKNQNLSVLGTAYEIVTENGSAQPSTVPLLATDAEIRKALPKFNPLMHGSVMIRKSALDDVGFYDEQFTLSQDYDLWFRMSKNHKFANLDEVLMLRREGKQTLEKEVKQNWLAIQTRIKAIRDGNSSVTNIVYLARPFLVVITPAWLKSLIRKISRPSYG